MGGDTRHFATLLADLRGNSRFDVRLVNTSRGQNFLSPLHNIGVAIRTGWALITQAWRVDVVSFHASDRGMVMFAPLVVGLAKLLRRRVIVRLFGGSFGDFYPRQSAFTKWIIRRWVLGADVILLQTQRMVKQLAGIGRGRLEWFSTYIKLTPRPAGAREPGAQCSRFVFLGHLWRTKGVETLLESATQLPDGAHIDLYGPLDEYTAEAVERRGAGRVHYRGFLSHSEVETRLWDYDCLVLPTFHEGEGYPGVIAEAFAHGLPVITTRWLAIPEIVDESCGHLIEPGDTAAFVAAVHRLSSDAGHWRALQAGAAKRAADFDHQVWARKFELLCEGTSD
jgi:glycosyltransferase involved in cell wall biosynthesis